MTYPEDNMTSVFICNWLWHDHLNGWYMCGMRLSFFSSGNSLAETNELAMLHAGSILMEVNHNMKQTLFRILNTRKYSPLAPTLCLLYLEVLLAKHVRYCKTHLADICPHSERGYGSLPQSLDFIYRNVFRLYIQQTIGWHVKYAWHNVP